MFFFGDKQKKLRKSCRHMLGHAHKVIAYRKDLLSVEAVQEITDAREQLAADLKAKADNKTLNASHDRLDKICRKHGGKVYPMTFGSENVEMIIVAAVLAIGVRTYFVQPFKIPTNSMWPTYAGLNATVYPPEEGRPSFPERFFLGATQGLLHSALGNFNYYYTAPNSGELVIPVTIQDDYALQVRADSDTYQKPTFGKLFQQIKTSRRRTKVYVGGTPVEIDTPGDFELNDVIVKSWFPEFDDPNQGLNAVYEKLKAEGRVKISGWSPNVLLLHTGIQLNEGDTLFDFNINSGDWLFVDRFSYNFVKPDIGDPIVFRTDNIPGLRQKDSIGHIHPDERYYIKRLVGMGGDELEVRGSTLYRNGEPITGADAFDKNAQVIDGYGGYKPYVRLQEGQTDHVLPGYLYAMGDNSGYSLDSRFFGYKGGGYIADYRTPEEIEAGVPIHMVPEEDLIGQAAFIFYPFSRRWGPAE